jgi:threonine/homoserine/homoserine lactone efflux protein
MPDTSTLVTFSVAALALFIIPGPAVLYIITRSLAGGRKAGLVSVAGIHAGSLVHIGAAVAGLSALLAASAIAFGTVRWAGAMFLIYLGLRTFLNRSDGSEEPVAMGPAPLRAVFRQGFVVNALNPKTAIFFLAFVPQFIDSSRNTTSQILILSTLFVVLGVISDGLYATVFGSVGQRLTRANWWRIGRWAVPATMYVGLGVFAGFAGGHTAD